MIQTAVTAQELYAKAALVDHGALARHQSKSALVDAEECLKEAFATDVRPAIREWRKANNIPADPLKAYRESGYQDRAARERGARNARRGDQLCVSICSYPRSSVFIRGQSF